jgi:hypothetical protein
MFWIALLLTKFAFSYYVEVVHIFILPWLISIIAHLAKLLPII